MEKRANTRVLFNVKSLVKYQDKSLEGRITNLSMYGMLLQTSKKIPIDTPVDVEIFMEGTTSRLAVNLQGQIVRSDEEGTAIVFKSIDIDSFVHLRNIVSYNEGNEEKIMKEFYESMKHHQPV